VGIEWIVWRGGRGERGFSTVGGWSFFCWGVGGFSLAGNGGGRGVFGGFLVEGCGGVLGGAGVFRGGGDFCGGGEWLFGGVVSWFLEFWAGRLGGVGGGVGFLLGSRGVFSF